MKRVIKIIAGCVCFASIILAGAENPDGSCNIIWTLGWMSAAVVSGLLWGRLDGRAAR